MSSGPISFRFLALLPLVLIVRCGADDFLFGDGLGSKNSDNVVFLDLKGKGEASFKGSLEARVSTVYKESPGPAYVFCHTDRDSMGVSIGNPSSGNPVVPVITVNGINGEFTGLTGLYHLDGRTRQAYKDDFQITATGSLDTKAILFVTEPKSLKFAPLPQVCEIEFETVTGQFRCDYYDGLKKVQTVEGAWRCLGTIR